MVDFRGDTALLCKHISRTQAAHLRLRLLPATFFTVVYKPHSQCSQTPFPFAAKCMKSHSKWQRDDSCLFNRCYVEQSNVKGCTFPQAGWTMSMLLSEGCLNHLTRLNKSPPVRPEHLAEYTFSQISRDSELLKACRDPPFRVPLLLNLLACLPVRSHI